MGLNVSMKFESKLSNQWLNKTVVDADLSALEMATDVHRNAVIIAPKDKRNLVNSGRIEKTSQGYMVSFGGTYGGVDVPYADIRHRINKKNPQTTGYLEKAGKNVSRNKQKYFRSKQG